MPQEPQTSCSILVVDDDFADDFKGFLEGWTTGEVRAAVDGLPALDLIRESIPDVVVTDFNMPLMNGLDLTQAIRCNPACAHVKIIMVSGTTGIEDSFLQAGGNKFLTKPVEDEELQQAVLDVLSLPVMVPTPAPPENL